MGFGSGLLCFDLGTAMLTNSAHWFQFVQICSNLFKLYVSVKNRWVTLNMTGSITPYKDWRRHSQVDHAFMNWILQDGVYLTWCVELNRMHRPLWDPSRREDKLQIYSNFIKCNSNLQCSRDTWQNDGAFGSAINVDVMQNGPICYDRSTHLQKELECPIQKFDVLG